MKTKILVTTWEECQRELQKISSENKKTVGPLWYRGQSDARWDLQTSLERRVPGRQFTLYEYYNLILSIAPEIKAFTTASWKLPDLENLKAIRDWANDYDLMRTLKYLDYVVYLRHHGFPSPLLDWTRSPYIAAYFAFASAKADTVAIYVYCEMPKSSYTYCMKFGDSPDGWTFYPHQRMLQEGLEGQDVVWKIEIPNSERAKVLRILDNYNLNSFSLFDSEEGLMETLAVREIDLRRS